MKLSEYIPQLKALAAKYSHEKATVSIGFTVWDFAHTMGLEGEYTISIHLDTCHQTQADTIESAIEKMENRLAKLLVPVATDTPIQEPELA